MKPTDYTDADRVRLRRHHSTRSNGDQVWCGPVERISCTVDGHDGCIETWRWQWALLPDQYDLDVNHEDAIRGADPIVLRTCPKCYIDFMEGDDE